jgi:hypothetical protein
MTGLDVEDALAIARAARTAAASMWDAQEAAARSAVAVAEGHLAQVQAMRRAAEHMDSALTAMTAPRTLND